MPILSWVWYSRTGAARKRSPQTVFGSSSATGSLGRFTDSGRVQGLGRRDCRACSGAHGGRRDKQAYLRTDFFNKRRELMDDWAAFVMG